MNSHRSESVARNAFISHSSADHERAMRVAYMLEDRGVSCWITPRDATPGADCGSEIITGIEHCGALVLLLSSASNTSQLVRNEVERAVSKGKPVFPVRIEDVMPAPALELLIASRHWIDAYTSPMGEKIDALARAIAAATGQRVELPAGTIQGWLPEGLRLIRRYRCALLVPAAALLILTFYGLRSANIQRTAEARHRAMQTEPSETAMKETEDRNRASNELVAATVEQLNAEHTKMLGMAQYQAGVGMRIAARMQEDNDSNSTKADAFRLAQRQCENLVLGNKLLPHLKQAASQSGVSFVSCDASTLGGGQVSVDVFIEAAGESEANVFATAIKALGADPGNGAWTGEARRAGHKRVMYRFSVHPSDLANSLGLGTDADELEDENDRMAKRDKALQIALEESGIEQVFQRLAIASGATVVKWTQAAIGAGGVIAVRNVKLQAADQKKGLQVLEAVEKAGFAITDCLHYEGFEVEGQWQWQIDCQVQPEVAAKMLNLQI